MDQRTITADAPTARDEEMILGAHLFVVLACGDPTVGSSRHRLHDGEDVILTRGPRRTGRRANTPEGPRVVVEIPDGQVSSEHARIFRDDRGWSIEDRGSKNGTLVNEVAVRCARLKHKDLVRVGRTFLIFRAALPTRRDAKPDVEGSAPFPALATLIPSLGSQLDALAAVATTEVPILLLSDTGTGKELLARAVHALSRRGGELVAVNCAAIALNLVEATLFGHRRGAFSGAIGDAPGLLRAADGGTLFLDEVGDMPAPVQAALLRALQEREVLPVGASRPVRIDSRVIAATHYDLEARVAAGQFREDLFARLAGFVFRLPPLRERREDLGLLVAALLRTLTPAGASIAIDVAAGAHLLRHGWPRNVRELEKCLAQAIALAGGRMIETHHLPSSVRGADGDARRPVTSERLVELLTAHGGSVQAVATALGTSRSQIHRMAKRLKVDLSPRGSRRSV